MYRNTCLMIGLAITLSGTAQAGSGSLSLNPLGAYVDHGATIAPSGFAAPLKLHKSAVSPGFAFGFSLPHNYVPNSTLKVRLLWETPDAGCRFTLRGNFLYPAGVGKPPRIGSANGGLVPLRASTPYTIVNKQYRDTIIVETLSPPTTTQEVIFTIKPGIDSGVGTLKPGYGVSFGIFRETGTGSGDTCLCDIGISGVSILYKTR